MNPDELSGGLANRQTELDNAALYRALAEAEKDARLAEVYRRMAAVEERHAAVWEERLRAAGRAVPAFQPSWRTRALSVLARRLGVGAVLPTLASWEDLAAHQYAGAAGQPGMAAEERSHGRLLRHLTGAARGGLEGGALAQLEGRHRATAGNALRAAVLGANDGLVSNLSLVMGVAGAELANSGILVTGLAGLLAGAISMALGEWLSVQSSRELYAHQIQTEQQEITTDPEEEIEELALIYQARGLAEGPARQLAAQIMTNETSALETLAREELGIDPAELGGSAWQAALTSFVLFALGASVPVLPFFFLSGLTAVGVSVVLGTVGLFSIGAATALFTGRTVLYSGLRMVLFGLAAAAVTYGIGRLVGVSLAG